MSIHHQAASGFSKQADAYARGRPDYPDAVQGWLTDTLGVAPGKTVLDLGAGTGKFTRLLSQTGATVIAVEPVAAMRAKLVEALPAVAAYEGTAEATGLPSASVDAVLCAQAFHWFATPAAVAEIVRILRPGGTLGLIWNVREQAIDWVAEISRIIEPYEGDTPRHHRGDWQAVFPAPGLAELQLSQFAYQHLGPPEQVIVDRILSVSFIASLPATEQAVVAAQLRTLIAQHPALAGQETVAFPYRTDAWHCHKTG
ncbi:class I SAM-dependent methyltransferase [Chitinimonas sp.]|uniref:class I SAM-dependent methyltransferase n=1 Tax=Chitinimonas sp. TaxID=1934313 RepID=UPI0035B2C06F